MFAKAWLYTFSEDYQVPDCFLASLDPNERQYLNRLNAMTDRRHFVIGHGLLRKLLKETFAEPLADWTMLRNSYGQWEIQNPELSKIHFSLSYSDQAVAIALSEDPIGLDIERTDENILPEHVASALSSRELTWLKSLEPSCRSRELFRIWTAKEAYSKYQGLGMNIDFQMVGDQILSDPTLQLNFGEFSFDEDLYHYCICTKGNVVSERETFIQRSFSHLSRNQ